ncbi:hypothetical protein MTR67_033647 [Solanum verrucosum]|nr:hypothetical protein MTR67_033647 [Solanum verrucosum]
MVTIHGP